MCIRSLAPVKHQHEVGVYCDVHGTYFLHSMSDNIFESIKRRNTAGREYWTARELSRALGYSDYRNFETVLAKAKKACKNSGFTITDHFGDATEMVGIGSKTKREITDVHLSRYACYLVVQGADSAKVIVGKAKSYFAIQTRRQEVSDTYLEDSRRVMLRDEVKVRNKQLAGTAKSVGVSKYAAFQDAGYMGLYGGLRQKDVKKVKRLAENEELLDHIGSEELAANLFRVTQTDAKLKRDAVYGQDTANAVHRNIGAKVRSTIRELGGTMPEKLPKAAHVKESRKRLRKKVKQLSI